MSSVMGTTKSSKAKMKIKNTSKVGNKEVNIYKELKVKNSAKNQFTLKPDQWRTRFKIHN